MVALGMRENGSGFVIDAVPSLHAGASLLRVGEGAHLD